MIKLNRMTRKRWAAMLLAAAFMIASAPAAYADGPSGPASDTAIAENSREEAKGPGAGAGADNPAGAAAGTARTAGGRNDSQRRTLHRSHQTYGGVDI